MGVKGVTMPGVTFMGSAAVCAFSWGVRTRTKDEDTEVDKKTLKRLQDIQKLPENDRSHIFYMIDNLIKAAKFKALNSTQKKKAQARRIALVFLFTCLDHSDEEWWDKKCRKSFRRNLSHAVRITLWPRFLRCTTK